jgi:hypothetical protein
MIHLENLPLHDSQAAGLGDDLPGMAIEAGVLDHIF